MARKTILVADDSKTVRIQLQRLLSDAGYDVRLAQDGREAVDMVRTEQTDLVILDIQMPAMDGYEACDRILQLPAVDSNLRIIFLTSDRGCHLEQLGRQFGSYLRKPIDGTVLLSTISRLLNDVQSRDESESTVTSGTV